MDFPIRSTDTEQYNHGKSRQMTLLLRKIASLKKREPVHPTKMVAKTLMSIAEELMTTINSE